MSELIDRIKNHPAFSELQSFGALIDAAQAYKHSDPSTAIDSIERLRTVLAATGKRLSSTDPALGHPALFTNIQNAIAKSRGELDQYKQDGNADHFTAANAAADESLAHLGRVVATQTPDDLTGISESAGNYRNAFHEYIKDAQEKIKLLTAQVEGNIAKVAALDGDVNAEKQKLTQLFSEQQAAFTKAQSDQQAAFTAAQADQQAKATNAAAESVKQFTESQANREKEYAGLIAEHSKNSLSKTLSSACKGMRD